MTSLDARLEAIEQQIGALRADIQALRDIWTAAPTGPGDYLTPAQAAAYVGVPTVDALRSRMKRGTLPDWCYTRMGGSLRFIRSAIDQWAQGNIRSLEKRGRS